MRSLFCSKFHSLPSKNFRVQLSSLCSNRVLIVKYAQKTTQAGFITLKPAWVVRRFGILPFTS